MKKILIIDDDEDLVNIFSTSLSKEGFEILSDLTSKGGLEKAKTEKPDLILLDQVLTDAAGNDLLKSLKQSEETQNIPVIIMSNYSQEDMVKAAIEEGASDYVFKYQVEPKDVAAKVKQALNIQ